MAIKKMKRARKQKSTQGLKCAGKVKEKTGQSTMNVAHAEPALLPERLRRLGSGFSDVALRLDALLKSNDGVFRIVSAGMMNPGKSTLLNALLGKEDMFKTADVRETTVVRSVSWKENVTLVDTPGFSSAVCEDDSEALSALRQADLVLFVHNVAIGGINQAELDVLIALEEILGEAEFKTRVLFINTRSDECPDDDLERNVQECVDLIKENLGCKLKSYVVSPKQYLQGIKMIDDGCTDDGKTLMEAGGVGKLSREILARAKKGGGRHTAAIVQLIAELESKKCALAERRDERKRKIQAESASLNKAWSKVLSEIRPFWEECKR